ncbi:SRPBCC family protein [Actinomadura sp. 7K507]|uniref:SRPBCC family protein n=1 Tax=Actinomadura sp. 7K507 TaxID=2530365 RepID=UPI001053E29F|nr:SRPBCC family protein [Actinomadura sp. 7K507]TDC94613.1 carbon monoxide dehydrogenase [Actinomadura sp. 7K507]
MELDHDFTVPVPVDQAWAVLLDVERVAACMPGATLDSVEGEEFKGRMKVKVGAMTITYRGSARIVSADESSRTVTLEASAKEARGSGTASATVQATLHEEGGTTRVTVHTKLNVTGRPAQFGRNILSEVGSKIITRFAENLEEELESSGASPAAAPAAGNATGTAAETAKPEPEDKPGPATPEAVAPVPDLAPETAAAAETPAAPQTPAAAPAEKRDRPLRVAREDDAIDLLEVAGPSVAKRAAPAVGGLVTLLVVFRFLRRRRKKR